MSRLSRQPTKNFVNMHDIIANPLTALPAAIDSIIRRPEPLDIIEVKSIFSELSFLILRAEEALAVRDTNAFGALMKLLAEGLTHSENAFEEGIQTFSLNSSLLQTFHTLFTILVKWNSELEKMLFEKYDVRQVKFSVESVPFHLHSNGVIEFIHVVSILCDASALKEECGKLFMNGLLWLLLIIYNDEDEVKRHVQLQRSIATALINLVKKSRINKQRFLSWLPIATCCVKSVDIFFQLQCVELLFRVSRQRRSVFNEVSNAFDSLLVDQLRDIPNNDKLLEHMENFVLCLNEKRTDAIIRFPLKKVLVADVKLTNSTNIFFTLYYFTIMVTNGNADNVTVFYDDIRSVTLTKEGKVLIRLDRFPLKLDLLLNHTAGMDVITLHMSIENLKHFKNSSIRAWILSALELRKKGVHQHTANKDTTSSQVKESKLNASCAKYINKSAAAAAGEKQRENLHNFDQVQKLKTTHCAFATSHTEQENEQVKEKSSTNSYNIESKEVDKAMTMSTTNYEHISANSQDSIRSTNHSLIKAEECTGLLNQSTESNHEQERETSTFPTCKSMKNATITAENVKPSCTLTEEEKETFFHAQAITPKLKSETLPTLSCNTPICANNASCRVKNVNTNTTGMFTHDACKLIRHIERLQDAKLEIRKRLVADKAQQHLTCLEEEINLANGSSKETCASWQKVAENELSQIRCQLEETQNTALLAVAHLNQNLERIKDANRAINDRCLCAEVALQRFIEESNSEEVSFTHKIRAKWAIEERYICNI